MVEYFFGDETKQALLIAGCESDLVADATNHNDRKLNGYSSLGIFQISMIHGFDEEYLYLPYNNIKVAYQLYKKQGWSPWKNCANEHGLLGG